MKINSPPIHRYQLSFEIVTGTKTDYMSLANAFEVLVLLSLLPIAWLAGLISIGLLWLYRRAVLKSMHTRANSRPNEPVLPEASGLLDQPVQTRLDVSMLDRASSIPAGPAEESLYSNLLRRPWRAAAIYVLAGVCYALIMAAAFLATVGKMALPPVVSFLFLFWLHAWPVVPTVNLVAATTRRAKLVTASAYLLVLVLILAAVGLIGVALSPFSWGQLVGGVEIIALGVVGSWVAFNGMGTLFLLAFLNRRVRAVGPLVLIFTVLALSGLYLALIALFVATRATSVGGLAGEVVNVVTALNTDDIFIGLGILGLGFVVFGLGGGWLILRWIRGEYERKKLSDQSITLDAIWLLYGASQSIPLVLEGTVWVFSCLIAFAVYRLVTLAGFTLLGHEASSTGKSPKLLLLRVFSLGKHSERLFDPVATHWRHVGSIQLIAGPDLATTTVEPHEFFDFLSGKLARRFIDKPQTLDLRLSEMDLEPNQDGRFRVNDFFCQDDTWRTVLSRLADESDAVLMDLRGFSPQNSGVIFEINELINAVPLERVVFVIDGTTDEQCLQQTAQRAWERMKSSSPNRSSTLGQLRLFRFTGSHSGELRQLLRVLSGAASAAPRAATEARPTA